MKRKTEEPTTNFFASGTKKKKAAYPRQASRGAHELGKRAQKKPTLRRGIKSSQPNKKDHHLRGP